VGNNGNNARRKVARPPRNTEPSAGIPLLDDVEHGITSAGRLTWNLFHEIPIQGALTSGAVGLYAATVFGVGELIAAGLSAYFAYRMFAFGEPLLVAVEKTIKFQMGELPKPDLEKRRRIRQAA
jgi:hypothetical protein